MTDTMLSFGELVFAVPTSAYNELQRSASWRWPVQERVLNTPIRQFVGKGDGSVKINGSIYDEVAGVPCESVMDNIYAAGDAATPRRLGFGNGRLLPGLWVITNVEETHRVFDTGGRARQIDFNITFAPSGSS